MADLLDQESGGPAQRRRRRTWTSAPDSATRPAPPADSPPASVSVIGSLLTLEQKESVIGTFRIGGGIFAAAEQAGVAFADVRATMQADLAFAVAVRQARGAARGDIRMALHSAVVEKRAAGVGLSLLRVELDKRVAHEAERLARRQLKEAEAAERETMRAARKAGLPGDGRTSQEREAAI
jgi:hypothetical protein